MPNPTDPHAIAEAIVRVDSLTNLLNAGSRSRLVERIAAAIENERKAPREMGEKVTIRVKPEKPLLVLSPKELQQYQEEAAARPGWSVCTPETPATKESAEKAYHPYARTEDGSSDEDEYYFCPICKVHWSEELPQ